MNILMLNYEYPPVGGGGGVAAANLAAELVKRGHHVDYITTLYPGFKRQETINGVNIYREPVPARKDLHTASIISMLAYPPVAIRRGLKLAKKRSYDVIHSHFAIPSGPAGYALSKKLRRPHVVSVYGGDIYDPSKVYSPHKHWVLHKVVKAVLKQADAIVGESSDICGRIVKHFASPIQPVRIPLGFSPPHFNSKSRAELGMAEDLIYAIAVSRLIPRKDYPTLLKAFAGVTIPSIRLLIIGDGPEITNLKILCDELRIANKVHFKGAVNDDEKFQYLNASDIFSLSPLHEGYGIVFQEAMYCKLPIVTTDNGGHRDFLCCGKNALLSSVGDANQFSHNLEQLCTSSDLRKSLGLQNQLDIIQHFASHTSIQYEKLFKQTIYSKAQRL